MATAARSLREMVEHWLSPVSGSRVHIAEFVRLRPGSGSYVRVEAVSSNGCVSMFFFRHRDGRWCVFPSSIELPAMRLYGC